MEYKKKDGISGVYIVFEIDCASEESVEAKMLQNNNICGLLACDFRYEDNRTYIYYDTTDKMAVSDIMKEGKMTYDILKEIYTAIIYSYCGNIEKLSEVSYICGFGFAK